MTDFAHLHVHTIYSFLDGHLRPDAMARACVERGISACAVTDHGHMGGALRVYKALKDVGVKGILGMEAWIGTGHLVLLARDLQGYDNLRALATTHARGPLSLSNVADHARGLYALTACVLGHVPAAVQVRDMDRARSVLRRLVTVFGADNVGVELQFHGPMAPLAPALAELARGEGLDVVATNDVHYLDAKDAEAQNVLMAIRQGHRLRDPRLFQHPSPDYWLKGAQDMHDIPQAQFFQLALANTLKVADKCQLKLDLGKPDLPQFADDENQTLDSYAFHGLVSRALDVNDDYRRRLEYELDVIKTMGYAGYYLIVQDFVNWARAHGVAVGPGRGSGAGSLVAYCLGITDLDPIVHKLFFERFLNPERVSMPDFDIDFAQGGRQSVIDYVVGKYGQEHVGQIATYMTLGPKAAIKDVARVLDVPFSEINEYTRAIPPTIRPKTLEEEEMHVFDLAMSYAPDLVARAGEDAGYAHILALARDLTGCCRQLGKHAGGVVIGRRPIVDYTPLTDDGRTAYDMKDVEAAGLVKFDFLGVKTLDVVDIASRAVGVDVRTLSLDEPAVYATLQDDKNWGVFQIESPGMSRMCVDLVPTCFDDIVAAVALYRPGPKESGMLADFIARKHGRQKVTYPHPLVEAALKDTWGTIVYQEQVMQVAQALAGYTLGGADLLRRAMGKKIAKEMHAQRAKFVDGAVANGVDKTLATEIFNSIEFFSGYSFNRSHAAGYAVISYQTAWLKYHHLVPFTAALLTIEDQDDRGRYVREARAAGVKFLGPDVNVSRAGFLVEDGAVRWGLVAIKGLGDAHLAPLIAGQPYADFFDFVRRSALDGQALKNLIAVGACDRFHHNRASMTATVAAALIDQRQTQLASVSGQMSMGLEVEHRLVDADPWPEGQELEFELKGLGTYVTGHPASLVDGTTPATWDGGREVTGVIVDVFERRVRATGRKWARVTIEDADKHMVALFFADVYAECEKVLVVGRLMRLIGYRNDEGAFVALEVSDADLK